MPSSELDLMEVVKGFKRYHRIVVTGPQRSGTQIASKIIADILDWEFVGEQKMCRKGFEHDERYFNWVSRPDTQSKVLQCPRISHACHLTPKPTLVVFMIRDVDEILASDRHRIKNHIRISPNKGKVGRSLSVFLTKRQQYSKIYNRGKEFSIEETPAFVYEMWDTVQKKYDFNWYELSYRRLEGHPFWLPIDVRRKFKSGTQTKL